MTKPLAGWRAFEAMGRSACSRGLGINYQRSMRAKLPMWARTAWVNGYLDQGNINLKVKA